MVAPSEDSRYLHPALIKARDNAQTREKELFAEEGVRFGKTTFGMISHV
jgi:hypothetical protein